jgi:hypothetical protein
MHDVLIDCLQPVSHMLMFLLKMLEYNPCCYCIFPCGNVLGIVTLHVLLVLLTNACSIFLQAHCR